MRLWLERDGQPQAYEVRLEGSEARVSRDGEALQADVRWLRDGFISLIIEGRSYELLTEVQRDGVTLHGPGWRLAGSVSTRAGGGHHAGPGLSGSDSIVSPMPGKVVNVLVKEGDRVDSGQGIVIVEAMKMENELAASRDGVVTRVHVKPGEVVEGNAPLVELEPC